MQTQITCPDTGGELSFDIAGDDASAQSLWQSPVRIECPFCQGIHEHPYRQIYVTGLMDQFQCLPADVREGRVQ